MVTPTKKTERKAQMPKRTRAQSMRHDPMYCERLLWNELRDRKLDRFKFKRQHLIASYIVDFICLEGKLIVEIDGGIHTLKREADAVRDAALRTLGYRVLRITNDELMRDLPTVLLTIREALRGNIF
jgi:very-short-patch-repair endonuclease